LALTLSYNLMYAICRIILVDIILVLKECHNNYRQAAVLYRNNNRFPHRRNHYMISRLVVSTATSTSTSMSKMTKSHINVPERDDPTIFAILENDSY